MITTVNAPSALSAALSQLQVNVNRAAIATCNHIKVPCGGSGHGLSPRNLNRGQVRTEEEYARSLAYNCHYLLSMILARDRALNETKTNTLTRKKLRNTHSRATSRFKLRGDGS